MTQTDEYTLPATECLDAHGGDISECQGPVEYRMAMSPTGKSFPRCEGHFEARFETQRGIVSRYGGRLDYTGYEDRGWADESWDY